MEYKSNSHKSKTKEVVEERKKVDKIVNGKVITKKRSLGKKFTDTFLSEDIESVKNYAINDLLIPGVKDAFLDCMAMLLTGSTRGRKSGTGSIFNYGSCYKSSNSNKKQTYRIQSSGYNVDDIILDDKGEAEFLLDNLLNEIDQYHKAYVSDLYQMIGKTTTFLDTEYGWESLGKASVRRVHEGYLLDLPKPVKLD